MRWHEKQETNRVRKEQDPVLVQYTDGTSDQMKGYKYNTVDIIEKRIRQSG
jgi:hypothetical protein